MKKIGRLLLVPAIVLLLFLFVYPLFFNFYLSFFWLNLYAGYEPRFIGFYNYVSVLTDPIFYNAFFNTLVFTVVSVMLEFIVGLAVALQLSKLKASWMGVVSALCMTPMFLSEVIEGIIGRFLFSPRIGLINAITESLFATTLPWLTDKTFAMWAVILVDLWKMFPFLVIIFLAAIISIPKDLMDAMSLDGASQIQQLRYLIIPCMLPVFAISILVRSIDAFTKVFGVVYVMTAGGPGIGTDVIPLRIFNIALRAFQWGIATTWGVFAFLFSVLLMVIYLYVMRWKR